MQGALPCWSGHHQTLRQGAQQRGAGAPRPEGQSDQQGVAQILPEPGPGDPPRHGFQDPAVQPVGHCQSGPPR